MSISISFETLLLGNFIFCSIEAPKLYLKHFTLLSRNLRIKKSLSSECFDCFTFSKESNNILLKKKIVLHLKVIFFTIFIHMYSMKQSKRMIFAYDSVHTAITFHATSMYLLLGKCSDI